MAAQTGKRSGAVRLPPDGKNEEGAEPESDATPDGHFEDSMPGPAGRSTAKRLGAWIFTTLLLALVGFLLGLMLGGVIST
jgi:hypothetical protein